MLLSHGEEKGLIVKDPYAIMKYFFLFQDTFYFDVVSYQGGSAQLSHKEMASPVTYCEEIASLVKSKTPINFTLISSVEDLAKLVKAKVQYINYLHVNVSLFGKL